MTTATYETETKTAGGVALGHGLTVNPEASDRFHALPPEERKKRLAAFRRALGQAFAETTVDGFIAEKRREAAREA